MKGIRLWLGAARLWAVGQRILLFGSFVVASGSSWAQVEEIASNTGAARAVIDRAGLSLETCLQSATQNNLELKICRQELASARAQVGIQTAAYWPTLGLNLLSERFYSFDNNQPLTDQTVDYNEYALKLDYTLFAGFRELHRTGVYTDEMRAMEQKLFSVQQEIRYRVQTQFARVQCLQAQLSLLNLEYSFWQPHLDQLKQAGAYSAINKINCFHLESYVMEIRKERMRLELELAKAQLLLSEFSGLESEGVQLPALATAVRIECQPVAYYLQAGLEAGPVVQVERIRRDAKAKAAALVVSQYFPEIRVDAKAGWVGRENVEKMVGGSLRLDWELWSGGRTVQAVQQAEAVRISQGLTLEKVERAIAADIRRSYHRVQALETFLEDNRDSRAAGKTVEADVIVLYREGRMSILDALQTQRELRAMQFSDLEANAERDAELAWLLHYLPISPADAGEGSRRRRHESE